MLAQLKTVLNGKKEVKPQAVKQLLEETAKVVKGAKNETKEKRLSLGGAFLKSYAWLNAWSLEKDRKSLHIVAKHHSFLHLLWNSKHLNPKLHWCFQGEDFVGQISKLTHSVSTGVSSTRLSSKVVGKCRILTHLFLTRSMQDMEEGYTDEV